MKIIPIGAVLWLLLAPVLGQNGPSPWMEPTMPLYRGITWTGPITKGGKNITLVGSIHSIYAEITKRNPNYDQELGNPSTSEIKDVFKDPIMKAVDLSTVECGPEKNRGLVSDIKEAIRKLRKVGGICGPGWEVDYDVDIDWDFMGCKWNGDVSLGVWKRSQEAGVKISCSYLADNAQGILGVCQSPFYNPSRSLMPVLSGEIKSYGNDWGAWVHGSPCDEE